MRGVMGLIEKEGKFLFGIEAKDGVIKGKWRLLGGKLEKNESAEEAMVRESFEEAGICIKVRGFLGEIKGDIGEIIVDMCHATWISGEPKPALREFTKLQWFTLGEAKKLDKDTISTEALRLFENNFRNYKIYS